MNKDDISYHTWLEVDNAIVMDLNHKQPGPVDQLEEEHLWYVQKHLRNTRNNIENLNLNNQISLWRRSKESLVIKKKTFIKTLESLSKLCVYE